MLLATPASNSADTWSDSQVSSTSAVSEIFENMNKWNSKKEIFDGNLKNVIRKI